MKNTLKSYKNNTINMMTNIIENPLSKHMTDCCCRIDESILNSQQNHTV